MIEVIIKKNLHTKDSHETKNTKKKIDLLMVVNCK